MKLLTTNDGDSWKIHIEDLLSLRDRLRADYWFTYTEMGSKPYKDRTEQLSDMISLGKVAESLRSVETAISNLQQIPRS